MILAADVGGTKVNLALFDPERASPLRPEQLERFASADYPSLEAIIGAYCHSHGLPILAACVGIAGPVVDGRCQGPNLPWSVDLRDLQRELDLDNVALINDLEATAYGLAVLTESDFCTLNQGLADSRGNMALIAAGTGLGEAIIFRGAGRPLISASEGGHCDFAPGSAEEIELLRYLLPSSPHVSWDHLVSGPGLGNIYRFLRDTHRAEEPAWLAEALRGTDLAAVISELALEDRSPLCCRALELFVALYGAEAGNLALKALACGGITLGGGIAPKILPALRRGGFMKRFVAKGRMQSLLAEMPVRVILNPRTALLGAARYARLSLPEGNP